MPLLRLSKLSVSFVLMHDKDTPILGSGQEARISIAPGAVPKDVDKAKEFFLGSVLGGAEQLWESIVKGTWFP